MGKPWQDKERLEFRYVNQRQTLKEIADDWGCHLQTVANWLERFDIERRSRSDYTPDKLDDKAWLRSAYVDRGLSQNDIAQQLGCAQRTVGNYLDKHGIETDGPGEWQINEICADEEEMRTLYVSEGLDQYKIGERIGVDPSTVNRWLHRHGIETRRRGGQRPGPKSPFWIDSYDGCYGPNYEEQRQKALKRDGYQCRRCGMGNKEHKQKHGNGQSLSAHHIQKIAWYKEKYDAPEWYEKGNALENLLTVCEWCHKEIEGLPIDNR